MENTPIKLPARFDFGFHSTFSERSNKSLEKGDGTIVLDFSEVTYLDSSALGMVIMLHKKCHNAGKKVKIINAHGTADDLLRLANIDKLVAID
ncbi:STAS domain-containing protein [Gilvimarinus sp. SDUM040013]|uniref:STAS domain-containing protein n=1 Tax=Gilvimarinus gilvus TaxID=3058038 RepID=A0ABU4RUU7_9GAMM|nr:STAS domain-containing protein [Gilvimarinus sp. SDUM040013]MDO3388426.1 STAS domain-containing protein [Gilvimarinus sp. SDUM040013]MDX6847976.1 STAS domain-containing protein [Gilvimarinus sp. SDUM040013]